MNVVNKGVEEGEEPVISSRYSIVMATSKRARQIIAGDEPMVKVKDKQKPLSIAVEEMNQDTLRILTDEEKSKLEEATDEEETENTEE
ncbi:DNA-directed RNA polymerase subunit omega [Butyrivibrio proteoclasticus]|nr:DNA-directed RNA polymerase subunit omega [Butyrivibrio proteoclasticus]